MTIPTQAQLYEEVDRRLAVARPGRNALPVGVTVERRSDSAVHVRVTIESLQTMREEVATQIIEEGLLTAD